jgi:NTP pyrophosphatase (non-canonical NTP hydrolase)
MDINELCKLAHENAVDKGFYDGNPSFSSLLMQVVEELGEANDADRKGNRTAVSCIDCHSERYYELHIKDNVESELADVFIILAGICEHLNIDIDAHIQAKMRYNSTRERLHGKEYWIMADHIYCGSGKDKEFQDGGHLLTITLNIDEILAQYDAYGFTTNAGKRTIKVKVVRRREIGKYGETHTVEIDTFKPNAQNASQSTQSSQSAQPYQKRQESPSKPLSGSASGVPDFDDPPDFPDDVTFNDDW